MRDLNTQLAALEVGGAEKGVLQLTPSLWTDPLAGCAVLENQNTKDSPLRLQESLPDHLPYLKY